MWGSGVPAFSEWWGSSGGVRSERRRARPLRIRNGERYVRRGLKLLDAP